MRRDPEGLLELCMAGRSARLLLLANELGVFRYLATEARSLEEVCEWLGSRPGVTGTFLGALVALGLLRQDAAGDFQVAPEAREALVPGSPGYVGDNLRYQGIVLEALGELPEVLRTGKPAVALHQRLEAVGGTFVDAYIRGVADISRRPAGEVARLLAREPAARILDVGGGHGAYAVALLEHLPEAQAEILDLAETLEITRELQAPALSEGRLTLRAGNYHDAALAAEASPDLVLFSHVIHDESLAQSRALIQRAAEAVAPGGRVVVHDFALEPGGASPVFAALFSVNLMTYSEGRVYERSEYLAMLADAGLVDLQTHEVLRGEVSNPTCLFVGRRPGGGQAGSGQTSSSTQ